MLAVSKLASGKILAMVVVSQRLASTASDVSNDPIAAIAIPMRHQECRMESNASRRHRPTVKGSVGPPLTRSNSRLFNSVSLCNFREVGSITKDSQL